MADPLSLLRHFNIGKKVIVEKDEQIIFGELSWPKNVRTNFLRFGSEKDSRFKEYYTLESLVFFLKNISLSHPACIQHSAAENIPVVHRLDRRTLREYLCGDIAECDRIDESVSSEIPTQVQRVSFDSKPRIEGTLLVYKVEEQFAARSPTLKESILKKSRIEDTLEVEKVQKQPKPRLPTFKEPAEVIKKNNIKCFAALKRTDQDSTTTKSKLCQPSRSSHLCSKHFLPADIDCESSSLPKKLKENAVPPIFLLNAGKKIAEEVEVKTINNSLHLLSEQNEKKVTQEINVGSKNDPLHLLREFYVNKKDIIEANDYIIFGDLSWPKNARTNYIQHEWSSKEKPKEYYTLECLLFFLKNLSLTHAEYIQKAIAAKIPSIRSPDRRRLTNYLTGKCISGKSIDRSGPSKPPTTVFYASQDTADVDEPTIKDGKPTEMPFVDENHRELTAARTEAVEEHPIQGEKPFEVPLAENQQKLADAPVVFEFEKHPIEDEKPFEVPTVPKQPELETPPIDAVTKAGVLYNSVSVVDKTSTPVGDVSCAIVPFGANATAGTPGNINHANTTATYINHPSNTVTYVKSLIPTTNGTLVSVIPIMYVPVPINNVDNTQLLNSQNKAVANPDDDDQLTDVVKQMKNNILRMDQNMHALNTQLDEFSRGFQICKDKHKAMETEIETLKRKLWILETRLYFRSKKRRRST